LSGWTNIKFYKALLLKNYSLSFALQLLLVLTLLLPVAAQDKSSCPPSSNKKAVKYYEQALDAKKKHADVKDIISLAEKAVEEDPDFADAYKLIGDLSYQKRDFPLMADNYIKSIEKCPDAGFLPYYRLGNLSYEKKNYEEAVKYFKTFLEFGNAPESMLKDAELKIFRAGLYLHPVPFNPVPIEGLCTSDPEYLPSISPDNDYCFFTRRYDLSTRNSLTPVSVEKFMISERKNGKFGKGEPMPLPFNKGNSNNEGSASISIDNKHLYFTTNINGNFDICYSDKTPENKWGEIKNMGPNVNDDRQWDAQPSISPDGNVLYFASYRDSVNQTSDIYKITKQSNGGWSKPVQLSALINTNGNEKSPFIHPDNKTLYFSSDSLPGLGGYDIFMSKKDDKGNWTTSVNLGYPINTENDEVGFYVTTDGRSAYFASNKINGRTNYDIYQFDLPEKVRPEQVLFLKGELRDDNNLVPLAAKIELKNIATKESFNIDYDSLTGKYASVVLFNNDYILTTKKDGYAFNSTYFSKSDTMLVEPVKLDVGLKKIEVGNSYPLNNILFERNSAVLSNEAKEMIENFVVFLVQSPKVKVAIHGHTDDMGNPADNQALSDARARAVYEYIVHAGIDPGRVSSKGFGESKPLVPNTTEENRAKNRRTEFLIVNK
jgi:flagellar motor protein MotB/tetratricopeptide (TPR) repeat protein